MTPQEAIDKYGPIVNGKWAREKEFMVVVDCSKFNLPWGGTEQASGYVHHIYMNKDMVPMFAQAAEALKVRGYAKELKTFDGCFCIRSVRGEPSAVSAHSYGIAIDLNAAENPLGGPVAFSKGFVQCFKDAGFAWGGDFHRVDGMHFSMGF
jgi:hypothetical protein